MIIFLWTHPRSVSTAFERVMAERGDMTIIHEPFSGLYYEIEGKAKAVGYQSDGSQKTFEDIKAGIIAMETGKNHVFIKDMAYHCLPHLQQDTDWLKDARHIFLVRQPEDAIASHYAMNADVSSEEIGYETLWQLYELLRDRLSVQPLVISSEDLKVSTEKVIRQVCNYCEMEYLPEALNWRKPPPKEWKSWEAWHQDAVKSKKITNKRKIYADTVHNNPVLKGYAEHHAPFYELLKEQFFQLPKTETND